MDLSDLEVIELDVERGDSDSDGSDLFDISDFVVESNEDSESSTDYRPSSQNSYDSIIIHNVNDNNNLSQHDVETNDSNTVSPEISVPANEPVPLPSDPDLNQNKPSTSSGIYASKCDTPKKRKLEELNTSTDEDGQTCSICFEPWTTSGIHRLVALKCGHLYGQSCIEKWIKGTLGKCPQCNAVSKRSDIRKIYAKCLKALDTSERDRALQDLEMEKRCRTKVQLELTTMNMRYDFVLRENERLKKELMDQKDYIQKIRNTKSFEIASNVSSQKPGATFLLQKTIEICKDGGCRLLSGSDLLGMLVVTVPNSKNSLFQGYGIKKISTMDFSPSEYVPLHQKAIKDVIFHETKNLVLTASQDKTVKISSMISNTIVQSYPLEMEVWSCTWSKDNDSHFFAGLKNGSVHQFDMRMTNGSVNVLSNGGSFAPVVSMQYVENHRNSIHRFKGPLVGQLGRYNCSFFEEKDKQTFKHHPLPIEGSITSLNFESATGHLLVSCRPSSKHSKVTHMLCELNATSEADELACSCNITQVIQGGSQQAHISKSRLIMHPDNKASYFVCAGDESSKAALLWDASTGKCLHNLKAESAVFDLYPVDSNNEVFLTSLTEKILRVYKWGSE